MRVKRVPCFFYYYLPSSARCPKFSKHERHEILKIPWQNKYKLQFIWDSSTIIERAAT